MDAAELDVASVRLAPGNLSPFGIGPFASGSIAFSPFGPASHNAASSPRLFTAVLPSYIHSGITLPVSATHPVIDIDVNVKGSSGANSDVDLSVMVADIFHVPGITYHLPTVPPGGGSTNITVTFPGSQIWTWFQSGYAFVTSNVHGVSDLHIFHDPSSLHYTQAGGPTNPINPIDADDPLIEESNYFLRRPAVPDTGHWIHVDRTIVWHGLPATTVIHLLGGPNGSGSTVVTLFGSYLYANPFSPVIATLGIEHIPEPAAPVLLLGGVVSLACGLRARRRRQLQA